MREEKGRLSPAQYNLQKVGLQDTPRRPALGADELENIPLKAVEARRLRLGIKESPKRVPDPLPPSARDMGHHIVEVGMMPERNRHRLGKFVEIASQANP